MNAGNSRRVLSPSPVMLAMPSKVTELDVSDRSVAGVAMLSNRLYLVCQGVNIVFVFGTDDPFPKLDEINIPEVSWPWDICACAKTARLYVTDFLNACVWCFKPEDGKVVRWLNGLAQPYTLSVMSDGRVLITRQGHPSTLDAVDSDASLLWTLDLPEEVEIPNHAIESSKGTYIVSYGGADTTTQGILELDEHGKVLCSYPEDGSKLDRPYHVTQDESGRILVADYYNNRVIRLEQELGLDRVLVSQEKDGLNGPQRLLFLPESGFLFVGHYKGIDVYHIGKDV